MRVIDPVNGVFWDREWNPDEGLPGSLKGDLFFLATGIWPFEGVAEPKPLEHEHMLKSVATSAAFTLRSTMDLEGSEWCCVLERNDGSDLIWLAPHYNYSVIRRDLVDRDSGARIAQFQVGDYSKTGEGIWVPGWFSYTEYRSDSPIEAERSSIAKQVKAIVKNMRVNESGLQEIGYTPRRGDIRTSEEDITAPPKEYFEGGVEHLDKLAGTLMHYLDEQNAGMAKSAEFPDWIAVYIACVFSAVPCIALRLICRSPKEIS